jgi:putative radical SAM enzyme (TIGR03279 family)
MQTKHGLEIEDIRPDSRAAGSGLMRGDVILSVNSHKLHDPVDFMFYSSEDRLTIELKRDGIVKNLRLTRESGKDIGIVFKPFRVMQCRNNCIFCFVNQLPRGLRKTLYVKDEDYRMSFLYGNYITLTSLSAEDRRRISEQRLSPLYISVHSTDKTIRNRLLGNAKAPDIIKELKFLTDNKIRLHAQIVLCPGHNDGEELSKTINDLYRFYPYILSIAVVPVGLTMHRRQTLQPVEKENAKAALQLIKSFQKRFMKKHGDPLVYGADELYIKAETSFPSLREYGELPQIENGVGMVPQFMNQVRKFKFPKTTCPKRKALTFTGISFYPFLQKFTGRLAEKEAFEIDVVPVENRFFGNSITVTGLLTGRDVIRELSDRMDSHEIILVPDVVLKSGEDIFLDDISLGDMEKSLGTPVRKISSTPDGLISGICGNGL